MPKSGSGKLGNSHRYCEGLAFRPLRFFGLALREAELLTIARTARSNRAHASGSVSFLSGSLAVMDRVVIGAVETHRKMRIAQVLWPCEGIVAI